MDDSFTFGGAIISLARLIEGLDPLGIRPVVVSAQSEETMNRLFGEKRTTVPEAPALAKHETLLGQLLGDPPPSQDAITRLTHQANNLDRLLRWMLPTTLRYVREGLRHDVDLIHLNNGLESQLPGVYAANLLGVPCIVHTRGFPRFSRLSSRAIGGVDRFIAVSTSVERQLLQNGVPSGCVSVIHDAVDMEQYSRPRDPMLVRDELGIPPAARAFGLIGRIIGWKGVREFVRAAIRVLEQDSDAYALVVGDESDGDPAYYREVREIAERSGVGDRILFVGYRDDIPAIVWALDLLVHTSTAPEPFGLVLVEAMAAAKPVVAADRGGPLDIVEDGTTGLLVDPEDTKALARSILDVLQDPQLARKMGDRGQHRARSMFSIDRYASEVLSVYDGILNGL